MSRPSFTMFVALGETPESTISSRRSGDRSRSGPGQGGADQRFSISGGQRGRYGDARLSILGELFARDGAMRRLDSLSPGLVRRSIETRGANLIDEIWGGYVAIIEDAREGISVIRDPSGEMPCYYRIVGGELCIGSYVESLFSPNQDRPALDERAIVLHLLAKDLRRSKTCLDGIFELPRGSRLTVQGGAVQIDRLWDPWRFGLDDRFHGSSLDDVAPRLREEVMRCVVARSREFERILLGVSGGLDSSIVATCLKQAGAATHCFTLATQEAIGDEREWSRILCKKLSFDLSEEMERADRIDLARSHAAHLPTPIARLFGQSSDHVQMDLADRAGADAYFSGTGGDNVFCYLTSAAPIADRYLVQGLGPGVVATAMDMARMTGDSVWKAFCMGVARGRRGSAYRWPCDESLLAATALELADESEVHDWLRAPSTALPGKAGHIAWLLGIENYLEGSLRELDRPVISPLLSQPIVELCLMIPSWLWCAGGRNRAAARQAFAEDLPAAIVNRRTKGTPGPFAMQLIETHRTVIADMVLGGILATRRLIDCSAVEALLQPDRHLSEEQGMRLMLLLDVEAWSRAWAEWSPLMDGAMAAASEP